MSSSWIGRDQKKLALDQPEAFDRVDEPDQQRILAWITSRFEPARTAPPTTSYGMKHWMEDEIGIYVTNGAFKGAMLASGFEAVDRSMLNWQFRCRWTPQCEAITARGRRCSRKRLPKSRCCSLHHYMVPEATLMQTLTVDEG